MPDIHPHIQTLLHCIELEEKEEIKRYSLDQTHTLKALKAEGLAIHPMRITNKSFGYQDYPEFTFKINFPQETKGFRDGCAIECFVQGEEPIKGILLGFDGKQGEFRLYAPDFPDWIEDNGVGIKLSPNQRTTSIMKQILKELPEKKDVFELFKKVYGTSQLQETNRYRNEEIEFQITHLNESQQNAVKAILQNKEICIIHGPPGTGKTTTLIEAILQLTKQGKKILISAPSNTAVDNIAIGLYAKGVTILRVGNTTKVNERIFPFTAEGKLQDPKIKKEIKDLKIRAEQFRKMGLQYKRKFGKSEREQRNLLFKEVKNIREEIKKLQYYYEDKLQNEAQVILGTPIGLHDAKIKHIQFDTLIIDEAGQCLQALAWCIFPFASNYVLAGDHFQLPPTVLSQEAEKKGFSISILEACFKNINNIHLLDTQYRMRSSIAGFSSNYFYEGKLKTATHLIDDTPHIIFYDTAGTGFAESQGQNGSSLLNEGELESIQKIIEQEKIDIQQAAFISPYSGQVAYAKENLPQTLRISTIDSFQGQEEETILISLVRSNDDNNIGFLNDYRRMNVAITRAKQKLYVIGDSATLANDKFYKSFLDYVEMNGEYKTVWELG